MLLTGFVSAIFIALGLYISLYLYYQNIAENRIVDSKGERIKGLLVNDINYRGWGITMGIFMVVVGLSGFYLMTFMNDMSHAWKNNVSL